MNNQDSTAVWPFGLRLRWASAKEALRGGRSGLLALVFVALSGVVIPTTLGQPAVVSAVGTVDPLDCNTLDAPLVVTQHHKFGKDDKAPGGKWPGSQYGDNPNGTSGRIAIMKPSDVGTDPLQDSGDPPQTVLEAVLEWGDPTATDLAKDQIPGFQRPNQIGVTSDGATAIFTGEYVPDPTQGSVKAIFEYDITEPDDAPWWKATPIPSGRTGVAGTVNISNNIYVWGFYEKTYTVDENKRLVTDPKDPLGLGRKVTISTYNPGDGTISEGVLTFILPTPVDEEGNVVDHVEQHQFKEDGTLLEAGDGIGGNGDFAFDLDGNLVVVASSAVEKSASTYTLSGDMLEKLLANDPADPPMEGDDIAQHTGTIRITDAAGNDLPTKTSGVLANGITYGVDGSLFTSGNGPGVAKYSYDRATDTYRYEANSPVWMSDIGSCVSPPTLTLKKNLPAGRANPDDEFKLGIDVPGFDADPTRITDDVDQAENGDQLPIVSAGVAQLGASYTIYEEGAVEDPDLPELATLADYTSRWECIDASAPEGTAPLFEGEFTADNHRATFDYPQTFGLNLQCTIFNEPTPLPTPFTVEKSSDPVSGTTVNPGETVDYTITFTAPPPPTEGRPAGPAPVDYTDDISGVLDDADLTVDPTVNGDGLTASAVTDGKFAVAGEILPGSTVTVTYSVTVKDEDDLNDHDLLNFVFPTGTQKPDVCDPATKLCTEHPVPELVVEKTSDPPSQSVVNEGDTIKYTIDFSNADGKAAAPVDYTDDISGVLDDADITIAPALTTGEGLTVSEVADGKFTITGELGAGAAAAVTYEVKVKDPIPVGANRILDNYVVPTGTDPPTECLPDNKLCTVHRVPGLSVSKTSDPKTGTTVFPGDTVDYTLTFDNSIGQASAPVDYTDDISGVLDDADLTVDPTVNGEGLTASAVTDGRFTVTGELAVGATVTVTYSVKVKEEDDLNDHDLLNFVFPTGTQKPDVCDPATKLCTEHPVPELVVEKTSDPPSQSVVNEGDTIKYTIDFSNADGKAAAPVDYTDDISGVLDDADITVAPALTTGEGLTVSEVADGKFTITGELGAGAAAAVTYEVKVKDPIPNKGANRILDNYVVPTGTDPPTECLPDNKLCTVHRVPGLSVSKTSDPETGTTVKPDDTVSYTLTFDNALGKAPAPVDYTDDYTGVLDDASLVSEPTAVGDGLTVTPVSDGVFTVTGEVAAGEAVRVTYEVKVNNPDKGDHLLLNYLFPTSEIEPPTECLPENKLCTKHPVPELVVKKSSDPEKGTTVTEGQTVKYSIELENTGQAAAVVDLKDDISGVLDDAAVTVAPASDNESIVVGEITDGVFTMTGELAAGGKAAITYEVKVNTPDDGDRLLENFVFEEKPQEICLPDDDLCTVHPVPKLEVKKTSDPESFSTVKEGDTIDYTISFANKGQAAAVVDYVDDLTKVLDDATISAEPTLASGEGLTVSAVENSKFTVKGELAAGAEATVTYSVVVGSPDVGDNRLDNFVYTGEPPTKPICEPGDPLCTTHYEPALSVRKLSDPPTLTVVAPGDKVAYTLEFNNSKGQAPAPVDYTDDITGVLDDAEVVSQPTVEGEGLTAGSIEDGQFTVTGELAPGAKASVTYEVMVNDPDKGDHVLLNFLFKTGDKPEPVCEPGDPLCTEHPVPDLDVWKTSDPVTGTQVNEGQTVKYMIAFDNVGAAPIAVDYIDDISGVLDDATVTVQPVVSGEGLEVSTIENGVFTVKGELGARAKAVVTYEVKVNTPDTGDRLLLNFVFKSGDEKPPECVEGNRLCTKHPVPTPPTTTSTTTTTTTPGTTTTTLRRPPTNPVTGAGLTRSIEASILLLVSGGAMVAISRRRRLTL